MLPPPILRHLKTTRPDAKALLSGGFLLAAIRATAVPGPINRPSAAHDFRAVLGRKKPEPLSALSDEESVKRSSPRSFRLPCVLSAHTTDTAACPLASRAAIGADHGNAELYENEPGHRETRLAFSPDRLAAAGAYPNTPAGTAWWVKVKKRLREVSNGASSRRKHWPPFCSATRQA